MKKLIILGILAIISVRVFAVGITYLGKITKEFDLHIKIMHIGKLGDVTVVGLSYIRDKDIGGKDGFGFITGFEFNYGNGLKFDN